MVPTTISSTATIELRPRSVGELLDLTFTLYRHNIKLLASIAALVAGPILVLTLISNLANTLDLNGTGIPGRNGDDLSLIPMPSITLVLMVIAGIVWPWMDGALTFSVIERVLGRMSNWHNAYRATRHQWAGLWIANILRLEPDVAERDKALSDPQLTDLLR